MEKRKHLVIKRESEKKEQKNQETFQHISKYVCIWLFEALPTDKQTKKL